MPYRKFLSNESHAQLLPSQKKKEKKRIPCTSLQYLFLHIAFSSELNCFKTKRSTSLLIRYEEGTGSTKQNIPEQTQTPCNPPNRSKKSKNRCRSTKHLHQIIYIINTCFQNTHNGVVLHICFSFLDILWNCHCTNKPLVVCGIIVPQMFKKSPSIVQIICNGRNFLALSRYSTELN